MVFHGQSDLIWTRRQVYFSMVTALRRGHYRREWQEDWMDVLHLERPRLMMQYFVK